MENEIFRVWFAYGVVGAMSGFGIAKTPAILWLGITAGQHITIDGTAVNVEYRGRYLGSTQG